MSAVAALGSQDLPKSRRADLELLLSGFAGREHSLDLVSGPMDHSSDSGVRRALRVREQFHRGRDAREARRGTRGRSRIANEPLDHDLARDRQDQEWEDQVRTAALVLLRSVGRVEAAALI